MAEKFERTNGAAPGTEFERSIARSAAAFGDVSPKAAGMTLPLVDRNGSALTQTRPDETDDQLQALKSELETRKHPVASIATTARGLAAEKVDVIIADVEKALTRNVFASVGIAAFVVYLWGRTR